MSKQYSYLLPLPMDKAIQVIKTNASQKNWYIKLHKNQLILRVPKLFLGEIPISFQVSFVGILCGDSEKTTVQGRLDAPRLYYQIIAGISVGFGFIFLLGSYFEGKSIGTLLPLIFFIAGFEFVLVKVGIHLSRQVFKKQSRLVLEFLKSLEETTK